MPLRSQTRIPQSTRGLVGGSRPRIPKRPESPSTASKPRSWQPLSRPCCAHYPSAGWIQGFFMPGRTIIPFLLHTVGGRYACHDHGKSPGLGLGFAGLRKRKGCKKTNLREREVVDFCEDDAGTAADADAPSPESVSPSKSLTAISDGAVPWSEPKNRFRNRRPQNTSPVPGHVRAAIA
jgi:hypothetical protein